MYMFFATSDKDGEFRFRGVGPGTYSLAGTAYQLTTPDPVSVTAEITAPAQNIELKFAAALSVSGRVLDEQKQPVAGARVAVLAMSANRTFFELGDDSVVTQTDGSFVVDGLLPGTYRVRVPGYLLTKPDRELVVEKTDLKDVVLDVETLGSISGRVTRAGKPVEGASINARPTTRPSMQDMREYGSPASAASDADGRFTLRGLPASRYHVYAESKRVGAFTKGPEIDLAAREAKTGVEIEMELAGSIAGVVFDQADAPVAGVHVRFALLGGQDFGEATTGDDGAFKATALSGGGEYAFELRATSSSAIVLKPAGGKRFTPIAVKDGNTQITGVRIKIRYDRLAISGRVLTSAGAGAPDVSVTAEQTGRQGWSPAMAMTDTSGAFTLRDLPAGSYTIRAQSAFATQRANNIAAGAKGVELRLPALGTIEGTLEGFAKTPSVSTFKNDDDMDELPFMNTHKPTISGNRFTFTNLPVGEYRVFARSNDGEATAEVMLTAGAKASVKLTNNGYGSVEGRVVDDKNAPLSDARCFAGGGNTARPDANGGFRIERVPAGEQQVVCYSETAKANAHAEVTVARGTTVRVDLVAKTIRAPVRGYSGLTLEQQMSDTVVKQVDPGSPAEAAGVKIGDTLLKVDDRELDLPWDRSDALEVIETRPAGTAAKLDIERDDKQLTLSVKIAPAR
jgi:hypothetical protein